MGTLHRPAGEWAELHLPGNAHHRYGGSDPGGVSPHPGGAGYPADHHPTYRGFELAAVGLLARWVLVAWGAPLLYPHLAGRSGVHPVCWLLELVGLAILIVGLTGQINPLTNSFRL